MLNKVIVLITLTKIPPKNKNCPRSAKSAATESDANVTTVPTNAVTIMDGFTLTTYLSSGPIVCPEQKPNAYSIATRL